MSIPVGAELAAEKKEPKSNPYIISKRTPTQFNQKVPSVVEEGCDSVFVACGNTINVYSLTTGIQVTTLRSKRQQPQQSAVKGDVHKGVIVAMSEVNGKVNINQQ